MISSQDVRLVLDTTTTLMRQNSSAEAWWPQTAPSAGEVRIIYWVFSPSAVLTDLAELPPPWAVPRAAGAACSQSPTRGAATL